MQLRPRQPADIPTCVAVLAVVHAADGYPLGWPADPAAWLTPAGLLAAWVAETGQQRVTGHVALCRAAGDEAAVWSTASALPPERLAEVARLFVAPGARGQGVGAALLAEASAWARAHDLRPALQVLNHDHAAVALYERAGWHRVATGPTFPAPGSGAPVTLLSYLAPE
jgi:GNAT superfamily N-acetyltransferase